MDTNLTKQQMAQGLTTFFIFILLSFFGEKAEAQQSVLKDSLILDSSIRQGRLPNGFTYFLKHLPGCTSKLHMRLLSKAGASLEDDDQLSLAHAVEHLAFKATENFPSGIRNTHQLAEFGIGMYDLTATSGRRETEYSFDVPNDKPKAMNLGLLWFKDIIHGLKLTKEDIDQVRGELRQEHIIRNGDDINRHSANSRLYAKIFPCGLDDSNFFEHLESFNSKALRRYYRDWYRPDLMAVSIVGDFENVEEVEREIIRIFGELPTPRNPRELKDCSSAYFKRPNQYQVVEREMDSTKLLHDQAVVYKLFFRDSVVSKNLHRKEGLQRQKLLKMLAAVIHERLGTVIGDDPFFRVGASYLYDSRALPPVLEIKLRLENGKEKEAIGKVMTVIRQLVEYGLSEQEWARLKGDQLRAVSRKSLESYKYWNNSIQRLFIYGEALPANKSGELERWLEALTLAEFNSILEEFLGKMPEDIGVIAPVNHKALSFDESHIRSWISKSFTGSIEPYEFYKGISSLMNEEDKKKLPTKPYVITGMGPAEAKEILLENGVKVVLKNIKAAAGGSSRIKIHGFSLNGAKGFSDQEYLSALNAPGIIRESGVNGFQKFQIKKYLDKTSLGPGGILPYVGDYETGIKGEADLKDFEILLQLAHLYFTKPNKDSLAFENWKYKEYKAYQSPSYTLSNVDFKNAVKTFFRESIESGFFGSKFIQGTEKFEAVRETKFDIAFKSYKKLFGDPSEFTFVITGQFDENNIISLVQKYLGNLPSGSAKIEFPTKKVKPKAQELPQGPLLVKLPAPKNYQLKNVHYGVRFFKKATTEEFWKNQISMEALGGVTNQKVWALRFEKNYSLYTVGVSGNYDRQMQRYEIQSDIECRKEECRDLRDEYKRIVAEIKSGKISKKEFQQGTERINFYYSAKRLNTPEVIHERLLNYYRYKQPWIEPQIAETFVKSLTKDDITAMANKLFQEENFYGFLMKNEEVNLEF